MGWEKGVSGNPRGRPANAMAERFRKAVEPRLDEVIKAMADAAANGDAQAAKLLLDRAIPPFKPVAHPTGFHLEGGSLTERAESILSAVSDGALAPADGKGLIDALTSLARLKSPPTERSLRMVIALHDMKVGINPTCERLLERLRANQRERQNFGNSPAEFPPRLE